MPPPFVGIGAKNATALITPQHPQRLGLPVWTNSTTAFGTRSARADLIEIFGKTGSSDRNGPQDSTTSFFFQPQGGSLILLTPMLIGADNATMNLECWLWEETWSPAPGYELIKQWVPQFLCEVTATACAKVGRNIAVGQPGVIPADARYCDTLAFPTSQAADDAGLSPLQTRFMQTATAGDTIARIALDYVGAPMVEVRLKMGSSASYGNCGIKTV